MILFQSRQASHRTAGCDRGGIYAGGKRGADDKVSGGEVEIILINP